MEQIRIELSTDSSMGHWNAYRKAIHGLPPIAPFGHLGSYSSLRFGLRPLPQRSDVPERDAGELTTAEGRRLLEEIKQFGNPLMIFTGGDPLKRADLYDLARYSVQIGLRTNITPSATPLLTADAIDGLRNSGISRMAIGLDGPDAPTHDGFRGESGAFDRAIFALGHAREIGLETQVLTTVGRHNLSKLGQIAERVAEVQSKMWSLFFLVRFWRAGRRADGQRNTKRSSSSCMTFPRSLPST